MPPDEDVKAMAIDLQAHHDITRTFPSRVLLDHLQELIKIKNSPANLQHKQHILVPNTDVDHALRQLDIILQGEAAKLVQVMSYTTVRGRSRRRSMSEDSRYVFNVSS